LTSCENNIPGNSTSTGSTEGGVSVSETATSPSILTQSDTNNSQVPFHEAAIWGPVEVSKGYMEDLYINGEIGIGSVSYDIGKSTEGTYIYALDVSNGDFIGDVRIPGRCYAIDIYGTGSMGIWFNYGFNGGFLCFYKEGQKKRETSVLVLVLGTVELLTLFMIHVRSSFIWKALPFLAILQFPWRFLTISVFLLAVLAGAGVKLMPKFEKK